MKRYVPETGSAWIRALSAPNPGDSLIIARITWVEVRSALARRQREGSLTPTDATLIIQRFRSDLNNQYQVIELDATLAETAGQLVGQYSLRAYDAVQMASVLFLQLDARYYTIHLFDFSHWLDDRLSAVAISLGLLTDNPNHHP